MIYIFLFFLSILPLPDEPLNNSARDSFKITPQLVKQRGEKKKDLEKLSKILKNTADYCEKLEKVSIYYFCHEKVKETIYPIPKKYRGFRSSEIGIQSQLSRFRNKSSITNEYLYDYQMIRKRKKAKEKRVLLRENEKAKYVKNASLKTLLFNYRTIIYGPLVFEKKQQDSYDFEIIGEEVWHGRNILVIRAIPKPGVTKTLTWGKFWVDEKDFSILKIKISQKSIGNYQVIEKKAMLLNSEPRITIILDYDIEKNGIRFPSKVSIEEAYINNEQEVIVMSKINVDYRDYQFFTVEVKEVKIKKDKD